VYVEDILARDEAGRITAREETVEGGTPVLYEYGYDLRGRLQDVFVDGVHTAEYLYDANGNRLSRLPGNATPVATYDDQDRMLTHEGASYTYDAEGSLDTRTDASGVTDFDYDVLGALRRVVLPTGDAIEYIVDPIGRRIGKKLNGVKQWGLLYKDALEPVAELNASNSVVATYVYGTKAHVPDFMVKGGVTYRIVSDHLGSVRLVVNTTTGVIAQRMDYDEWGN
jgi:YD repeat-containing protein